ncbi:hypothetical protein EJB05_49250, partial [Eragrostis curvula]
MYATKPLSLLKRQPKLPPPEGRNCGYFVVKEPTEEDEHETCCWGTCPAASEHERVWELPFPQNLVLTVWYSDETAERVLFVPVPDRPLASNRYYAVVARGKRKGLVRACSRAEDVTTCFGCSCIIKDAKPRPFDPADVYLQMEIVQRKRGLFTARAVAADGIAPAPYRYRSWQVYAPKHKSLAQLMPDTDAIPAAPASTAAIGRWYCPFYLIKQDGVSPRQQMDSSPFYEVTLEQRWDANDGGSSKITGEKVFIGGSVEAMLYVGSSLQQGGAYSWFRASGERIGVCTSVWERMRWLERRCGGRVLEEAGDDAGKLMVQRFMVKRMDGSIAVTFDFVRLGKVTAPQQRAC